MCAASFCYYSNIAQETPQYKFETLNHELVYIKRYWICSPSQSHYNIREIRPNKYLFSFLNLGWTFVRLYVDPIRKKGSFQAAELLLVFN
jgi:hypothetical protein